MKIIVPMAGMGTRMRPHTLTIPKPLIPLAGKPIVQHIVEEIAASCGEKVEEVAFIVGRFGKEVEEKLVEIAERAGAKGSIHYQDQPLGTAHAILSASPALTGKVVVALADTLFKASFRLSDIDSQTDGVIWVKQIEDPRAFGVVTTDNGGIISGFVEKPQHFVSDMAIIGIYYFKDGENLKSELQYLIDHNIREKGEYQLTTALENMRAKGSRFMPGTVDEWLDCGNKETTLYTNQRILELNKGKMGIPASARIDNSMIIEPCYIGEDVQITNSVIGPHVSIGIGSVIENCLLRNSIIQSSSNLKEVSLANSMVGNHTKLTGTPQELSLGDYSFYS
jgi:glucose-1-phosphate thymidylyltransferase